MASKSNMLIIHYYWTKHHPKYLHEQNLNPKKKAIIYYLCDSVDKEG